MASMQDKDYYKILEVDKDASQDEIRRAFQKKARLLHPDVNKEPGAEERFKELSEAYAVLGDPEKRKRYDAMRLNPFASPYSSSGYPGSYSPGQRPSGFVDFGNFGFGGFSSFVNFATNNANQSQNRAYNPQEGSDVVIEIELSPEEARKGCKQTVTYEHYVSCPECGGSGSQGKVETVECPSCSGRGTIQLDLQDLFGFSVANVTCPECEGTGRVIKNPCHRCMGSGRVVESTTIDVTIQPHAFDMQKMSFEGKGNAGTNGDRAGDLIIRVSVPEERLTMTQAAGFKFIGFALPFLVFAAIIPGLLTTVLTMVSLPLILGFYLVFKDGTSAKGSPGWWKSGMSHLWQAALNASLLAFFIILMMSCSSSIGR